MKNRFSEVIQEPSYWVEEMNNMMYDSMLNYMENNNFNKTLFAEYLGISKGRLSQILNSGEINFSLEKLFAIALKIDKVPSIKLIDKSEYIQGLETHYAKKIGITYQDLIEQTDVYSVSKRDNIIQLPKRQTIINTKSFDLSYGN